MVPSSRSRFINNGKRGQVLSRIQKPRGKQKKMTEFFPPSPKILGNKIISGETTENQIPSSSTNINNIEISRAPHPHKYNTRPKKTEPRVFYGYEPISSNGISRGKYNVIKPVLKENSINIRADFKNDINVLSLAQGINVTDTKCRYSPSKSPVSDIHKPQRNTRRVYKYGTRIPSFNDIVKSRKKFLKFKEDVASVAELQKVSLPECSQTVLQVFSEENTAIPDDHLDCKHLTKEYLKNIFHEHEEFVIGIARATIPSKRHKLYMENPYGSSKFEHSELTFNISMSAFTVQQKVFLAHLAKKMFGANKLTFNNQYYFKVVLPDLCFKIFMQHHKLTEKEATDYLSNPLLDFIP